MNKKGFTLVEIIVCIVLIIAIGAGSVFGVRTIKNNIVKKELTQIQDKIFEAVNIYIETKREAKEQVYNEKNTAIIPLNVLEDEGIITFNDINIKEQYVISLLGGETRDAACMGTTLIGSWEIGKNSGKIIYLCTDIELNNAIQTKIESSSKATILTSYENNGYYIAKGQNPKNYVKFEVEAGNPENDFAFFPNDADKDLWRVIGIDDTGAIKLIYNKNVDSNNSVNYIINTDKREGYTECNKRDGQTFWENSLTLYKLKSGYRYRYITPYCTSSSNCTKYNNPYISYEDNEGWSILDIYDYGTFDYNPSDETTKNKKVEYLYDSIVNKDWLENNKYKYQYIDINNSLYELINNNSGYNQEEYFGTLTTDDINSSILLGKSWLYEVETLSGVKWKEDTWGADYYNSIYLDEGVTGVTKITNVFSPVREGWACGYYNYYMDAHKLETGLYYPVITLKTNIELIEDSSCKKTKISGTKDCPYLLQEKSE